MLLFIPYEQYGKKPRARISKHLMLLFILGKWLEKQPVTIFQNISCYCLSTRLVILCKLPVISKHLMLLFIKSRWYYSCSNSIISKHLMLLFINITCGFSNCSTVISKHLMLLFISNEYSHKTPQ